MATVTGCAALQAVDMPAIRTGYTRSCTPSIMMNMTMITGGYTCIIVDVRIAIRDNWAGYATRAVYMRIHTRSQCTIGMHMI